jgi:geranylgeranyl diphosphate synthase type II
LGLHRFALQSIVENPVLEVATTSDSLAWADYNTVARAKVEAALAKYTEYEADCPTNLAEAIRHSLLAPGKRLRPLLVLMAAEACGCAWERAMPAACAVEMIHTYSLIHDDLPAMDDDDLRRGRPTCHVQFGEATAILAGDALLAQAFEVMASGLENEVAARCCAELARAAGPTMLVGGQADDLAAEARAGERRGVSPTSPPTEQVAELERIHRRKTGAMIRVSLRLGGLVGRAGPQQLEALDGYGEKIGLAFQIIDDWLDVQGDEAAMGKRLRKDSEHGKLTFPALLGMEQSRRKAEELVAQACDGLSCFGPRATRLEALARYVLERNH